MTFARRLLAIDSAAALLAGLAMLGLAGWLGPWYGLPPTLLRGMGVANLLYGTYSGALNASARRPRALVAGLVVANAAWAVTCAVLAWTRFGSATWLGIGHFVFEGSFVGGLALLEWRWRDLLVRAPGAGAASA